MTTALLESDFNSPELNETSDLRVSIIYEDFASGVRAKKCVDRLAHSLNVDPEAFSIRLWSFNYLSEPHLCRLAAQEAAKFEMVFVATRSSGEPPATVKQWMADWLQFRESRPCALAIMPEESGENSAGGTALLRYMSRIAQVGGLDLVHPFGEPAETQTNQMIREITRHAINASPLLEQTVDSWQSYMHSGINE